MPDKDLVVVYWENDPQKNEIIDLAKESKNIKQNIKLFILIIVVYIIALTGLAYVLFEISNSGLFDKQNGKYAHSIILICSLVFIVILIILATMFLFD